MNLTKQFKALANRNRLAIFIYLRQQGKVRADPREDDCCNVGEIAAQFDLALSTVSHHLRILHEADLIHCEQRGQFTYCLVNQDMLDHIRQFF